MEQEKRIRREIANSNERRRMQSINAGFQSLRTLLPHHDGEKLSKAAILQQTAEYIYQLEQEKTRLLTQNCQLKRVVNQQNHDSDGGSSVDSPLLKRKKSEPVDSVDEGIGSMSPPNITDQGTDDLKREMLELRIQLDRERRLRMILEEQTRSMETQLYPDRLREAPRHYQPSPDSSLVGRAKSTLIHDKSPDTSETSTPESRVSSEMSEDLDVQPPSSPESIPSKPEPKQERSYSASTSRQNLETIVEAIRHLEGDHLFRDEVSTTAVIRETKSESVSPFNHTSHTNSTASVVIAPTNVPYRPVIQMPFGRPGVIVSTHS